MWTAHHERQQVISCHLPPEAGEFFNIPNRTRQQNEQFFTANDSSRVMMTSLSRLGLLLRLREGRLPGCLPVSAVSAAERCLPVDASHLCSITIVERGAKQLTPTFVDGIREPHSRVWHPHCIFTAVDQLVTVCMESWHLDESDWIKVPKWLVLKLILPRLRTSQTYDDKWWHLQGVEMQKRKSGIS